MRLKEAIEYFKNRKNKNNVDLEILYPDCANVQINDLELAVTIGQWLGILPDAVKTSGNGITMISSLSADEYLKKRRITNNELALINKKFANILKMIGFGKGNDCTLKNFDKEDLTFICEFNNTGEIAKLAISFGDGFEYSNEIKCEFDNIIQNYSYFTRYVGEGDEKEEVLNLEYIIKKTDWDRTFRHDVSMYNYYGKVTDDKYELEVDIHYPDSLYEVYPNNPYVNLEQLESVISKADIHSNLDVFGDEIIIKVIKDVEKCLIRNPYEYSLKIKMTINNGKERIVTNAFSRTGKFVNEFTVTRRDRTITVKPNGEWSYDSLEWKVAKNPFNKISYTLKEMVIDESKISEIPTPSEAFEEAKAEAEEVRKLSKLLVSPKQN